MKTEPSKSSNQELDLVTAKIAQLQALQTNEPDMDLSGVYGDSTVTAKLREDWKKLAIDSEKAQGIFEKQTSYIKSFQDRLAVNQSHYVVAKQQNAQFKEELTKTLTAKNRLESLCRELQKQNKQSVKDSHEIVKQADLKREELTRNFRKTIDDVTERVEKQNADCLEQVKENQRLRETLEKFVEQHGAQEDYYKKQLEAKDLTVQLNEAKFQHQVELNKQETAKVELLIKNAEEQQKKEERLQEQLKLYADKFENIQTTIDSSNHMFKNLKSETKMLHKTIEQLKQHNHTLQKKCEQYDKGALEALNKQLDQSKILDKQTTTIERLKGLCRGLQAERDQYKQHLDTVKEQTSGVETSTTQQD